MIDRNNMCQFAGKVVDQAKGILTKGQLLGRKLMNINRRGNTQCVKVKL